MFTVCASISPQVTDCSLSITVQFKQASQAQIAKQNTAPYFEDKIENLDPVPCLGLENSDSWSFKFPKPLDKQNNQIT